MAIKSFSGAGLAVLAALSLSACSFDSMREAGRQQCRSTPDASAAQECIDRINRGSYEEYEQARQRATVTR